MVYLTIAWARYMSDPFNLARFLAAQTPCYEQVLTEISEGRKQTHWMWFIFPQLKGLGYSTTASFYAIRSIDEANAYLEDPILGGRLIESTQAVLQHSNRSSELIFGYPDMLKFHSSMTLFNLVGSSQSVFKKALASFYNGELDSRTVELFNRLSHS